MSKSAPISTPEVLQLELKAGEGLAILFNVETSDFEFVDLAGSDALPKISSFLDNSIIGWVKLVGPARLLKNIQLPPALSSRLSSQLDTQEKAASLLFYPDNGRLRVALESSTEKSGTLSNALPEMNALTRVLIVDDSPTIRKLLSNILDEKNGFKVVAEAADVEQADKALANHQIDLITLDIHMPGTDGVTYLEKMRFKPHPPVVMISSVNQNDAIKALKCLELGAVDYIEKPEGMKITEDAERIRGVLKAAAKKRGERKILPSAQIQYSRGATSDKTLIVLGASTGGVEALRIVISAFPENSPPVLVVQHMPPFFSAAFAQRLNDICKMRVKEAADGDLVSAGNVYIAPGGKQMKIKNLGGDLRIVVTNDPPVNRHAPSVDYLFRSVATLGSKWNVVAGLLTGMGRDGADGLLMLKNSNYHTVAESEETAIVFGMPREAVRLNAAKSVLPLQNIAVDLFKAIESKDRGKK